MCRKVFKRKHLLRMGSCALCAAMLLSGVPAYAVGDGVVPLYDEAYYAMTDYYGNLTEGSVVKSYITNGVATLTDYGEYDEVVNLTDSTVPGGEDGTTVFTFDEDAVPSHFYFQGETAKPFEALPWTLSVRYTLNGLPAKAEDLAGQTGVVEIVVDAVPNENASTYAKNNYTLEAMAVFNQDDILSLEAPGAQVQLIGNLRAVLFIALPGEEGHFTIRVGTEDFAFGGMTFLMVPATLSQLEEIAKLSQRKDDLEENYEKLSGSLDTLLDSLNNMSGSLYASANGLDQLNAARATISAGKSQVYDDADALRGDLDAIVSALDPVSGQIDAASAAVAGSKTVLQELTQQITSLRTELKDLDTLIKKLQNRKGSVQDILDDLTDMRGNLKDLEDALDQVNDSSISTINPLFRGKTPKELQEALTQAQALRSAYNTAGSGASLSAQQFIVYALVAGGKAADTTEAAAMYAAYAGYTDAGCTTQEEVTAAATQNALTSGLADPDEIAAAVQKDVTQWAVCSYMNNIFTQAGGTSTKGLDFEAFVYANLLLKGFSSTKAKATTESLVLLDTLDRAEPGLTAVLISQSGKINDQIKSLNGTINKVNSLMDDLTAPASSLVGQLAGLCRDMEDLTGMLDDVDDLGDIGSSAIQKGQDILDQVDALYQVLDGYEPQFQSTLTTVKSLSATASQTVLDTGALFDSAEDLMKTSGAQLDAGTKQTLEGLAATLRSAANSMNKTGDVKTAKNNISSIIEDTWEEYTGDVNNLLLMDATAPAESLTDARNSAPSSVQVLIRTQEITGESEEAEDFQAPEAEQTTFLGRVGQMFKGIWAAVTGIFH